MADSAETKWRRRRELSGLLLSCRSRLPRTDAAGRDGRLRQQDVADLVGVSVRYYSAFERGEVDNPSEHLVESVAAALRMGQAERSALYVLALGHDPPMPMPLADLPETRPRIPAALRELVRRLDPTPAVITDEMWTILARNSAMSERIGDYCDRVSPDEQNVILYLFSPEAEKVLTDVRRGQRAAVAGLRYQYARNIASPRFAALVARLLETGPEARAMWERHDVEIPPRRFHVRIRDGDRRGPEICMISTALSAQLSLLVALLPELNSALWTRSLAAASETPSLRT